jgi:predicted secreted acid phosphatase
MLKLNFGMIPQLVVEDIEKAEDPAIEATLKLYEYAKEKGVAIFFITGRHEILRDATQKNLKSVGYVDWDGLYLKPNDYKEKSVIPYKSSTRKMIQQMGSYIVVNIGDQFSDLAGGYAERVFKLPNPFYFIP